MALQMLGNNKMVGLVLGESKSRRREFLSCFGVLGGGVEREHSKFRGRVTKANYNSVSESDDEAAYGSSSVR
jgi:hypothetical protein